MGSPRIHCNQAGVIRSNVNLPDADEYHASSGGSADRPDDFESTAILVVRDGGYVKVEMLSSQVGFQLLPIFGAISERHEQPRLAGSTAMLRIEQVIPKFFRGYDRTVEIRQLHSGSIVQDLRDFGFHVD